MPDSRKGWDRLIVLIGFLLSALAALLENSALGLFGKELVVLSLILAAIGVNHLIPRPAKLRIVYRNPDRSNRPEVWRQPDPARGQIWALHVFLVNDGEGDAEKIRAEFSVLNARVLGRNLQPLQPDGRVTVEGPMGHYQGGDDVVGAGQELFLGCLMPENYEAIFPQAVWSVTAKGAPRSHGEVLFKIVDTPI